MTLDARCKMAILIVARRSMNMDNNQQEKFSLILENEWLKKRNQKYVEIFFNLSSFMKQSSSLDEIKKYMEELEKEVLKIT